ncbi:hypothetical protein EV193_102289 [Herbihabitans rhizosphaerae]|uniref:Uncharacterized protein n=1 Tax=Herbihabitans rhizosphaerae TaxID=1872711 RepID=A0A4Q7L3J9_9PSEU|nr:hypothetical protein [Herbihabitans rhizosphaerae]RZS43310.1 hypothetical protein EV193_102289 [Herbihabitans rhizosphaerae]
MTASIEAPAPRQDSTATLPVAAAAIAGAVAIAFIGAPQSFAQGLVVGPEQTDVADWQLPVYIVGAIVTAVALLFVRLWRWQLPLGAVAIVVGFLIDHPSSDRRGGLFSFRGEKPAFADQIVVTCLKAAGGALVLVGVLAAVLYIVRSNRRWIAAPIVGLLAAGGAGGSQVLLGPAGRWETPAIPLVLLVVAALVTVAPLLTVRQETVAPQGNPVAAIVALLLPLLTTVVVLGTDKPVTESTVGKIAVVAMLVAGVVLAAAAGVRMALAATALGLTIAAVYPFLITFGVGTFSMSGRDDDSATWVYCVVAVLLGVIIGAFRFRSLVAPGVLVGLAVILVVLVETQTKSSDTLGKVLAAIGPLALVCVATAITPSRPRLSNFPQIAAFTTAIAVAASGTLTVIGDSLMKVRVDVGAPGEEPVRQDDTAGLVIYCTVLTIAAALLVLLYLRDRRDEATPEPGAPQQDSPSDGFAVQEVGPGAQPHDDEERPPLS